MGVLTVSDSWSIVTRIAIAWSLMMMMMSWTTAESSAVCVNSSVWSRTGHGNDKY